MTKLAIVGSGIAGLGAAYYLREYFDLTIFEQNSYLGGHTNTVDVIENQAAIPIDTGFMVYNEVTYPHLTRLFKELGVESQMTDMSFSVQHKQSGLEYAGASYDRLFGDRKNILNLRFWRMLLQLDRFNKEAASALKNPDSSEMSLGQYIEEYSYGDDFTNLYIVPMCSALWSTPPDKMLDFPAVTMLRFFQNHGLLGVDTQHQWWTVVGGAREYVKLLLGKLRTKPLVNCQVIKVAREARQVAVTTVDGNVSYFDKVILACHADESLKLLDNANPIEKSLLSAFQYQKNFVTLHTDQAVMPLARRCWSSWNYRLESNGTEASTHYWMNSLQKVSQTKNYFVSVNGGHLINEGAIKKRITYAHPLFSLEAIKAQSELPRLNCNPENEQIYFCGSYFRYGFHEDALASAFELSRLLQKLPVKI